MLNDHQMRRKMARVSHERRVSCRVHERTTGERHETDLHRTMRGGPLRRPDVHNASRRFLRVHGLPLQRTDVAPGRRSTSRLRHGRTSQPRGGEKQEAEKKTGSCRHPVTSVYMFIGIKQKWKIWKYLLIYFCIYKSRNPKQTITLCRHFNFHM